MECNRGMLIALVVALVIAVIAAVVFGAGWYRQKNANAACTEAASAVCVDLVNAEAAHTLELLRQTVLINTSLSGYDSEAAVQMIRDYLQKSYWLVSTYRSVGAACPQTWADVEARMAQQIQALSTARQLAQTDPDAAMRQATAALQNHKTQLDNYFGLVSLQNNM